ncbi:hypothetical protein BDW62DRAFT_215999 [Aspergillus aurantiobrunneus]
MIFYPPSWLPAIPLDLASAGPVGDFVLHRLPGTASEPGTLDQKALVSAITQKGKTHRELAEDVETLAAGLAHDLQWAPNEGAKVIAVLSENTVDYHTYTWATHCLGGTSLLLHASTSPAENAQHMRNSNCNVLIVSPALFEAGRAVAAATGKPNVRLYVTGPMDRNHNVKTLDELLELGKALSPIPALDWSPEQAGSRIAYLCATSGTSGAQHNARPEVVLDILPFSHVQGIISALTHIYLRDQLIVHPTFDMKAALMSIQTHRINRLYVVPSVLAALVGNPFLFKAFDLSSVDKVYVGAGILGHDLYSKVKAAQPAWKITIGYGLTESSVGVTLSSAREYLEDSIGVLLPHYKARLLREGGGEVDSFDEPGDRVLGDDEATSATFVNGWLHTGDVALFRRSARGDSHLCIVDRLKDMIKVKGMQVSPVAIEDCLRQHPGVSDVAVIGVPDYLAGERPKAFVIPAKPAGEGEVEALFEQWDEYVQGKLTEPHWLRGRYELVEALPRTPSGKVTKGVLRQRNGSG